MRGVATADARKCIARCIHGFANASGKKISREWYFDRNGSVDDQNLTAFIGRQQAPIAIETL